jgi:hypothetical protein
MFRLDCPQLIAAHDDLLNLGVILSGQPVNLSNYTGLKLVLKASAATPDANAMATYQIGSGLTYINENLGTFSWAVSGSDVPNAITAWYRVDLTDSGSAVYAALGGLVPVVAA